MRADTVHFYFVLITPRTSNKVQKLLTNVNLQIVKMLSKIVFRIYDT